MTNRKQPKTRKLYTKQEIKLIKRRKEDILNNNCFCFDLVNAYIKGIVTKVDYLATKKLESRCPLFTMNICAKCVAVDKIDMYQAVRDLGLMQKKLFDE